MISCLLVSPPRFPVLRVSPCLYILHGYPSVAFVIASKTIVISAITVVIVSNDVISLRHDCFSIQNYDQFWFCYGIILF